jgi:peptidoglycan hydrolase CwlO-like protein
VIYTYVGVVTIILLLLAFFCWLRKIMATVLEQIKAATAAIAKVGEETKTLLTKVDELQVALNNAGNNTPEVQAALDELNAQIKVIDDLVPDAVQTGEEAGGESTEG